MYRLGILFVLLPIFMCADEDCSCLIYSKCIALVYQKSPNSTIDCSRLTHFERHHRSSLCKKHEKPYHCAMDLELGTYAEICAQTTDIYPGFRPTRQLGLHQDHCTEHRYQPFFIESNLIYQCIYEKSACNEEGQMVYNNGSIIYDRSCYCNFKKGYTFLVQPSNKFYCVPSIDDCTCYKKSCPDGSFLLDRDYNCIQYNGSQLSLGDSQGMFQSFETAFTFYNSVYDNTRYNKDIETNFQKLTIIIWGIVFLSVGLYAYLLFISPLSLTIEKNVILFYEDTAVTIEFIVTGTSIFKDGQISKKEIVKNAVYTSTDDSRKATFHFEFASKDYEGEYQCKIRNYVGITTRIRVTLKCVKELTVLEEWQLKDDQKIVKTDAMEKIRELLDRSNCVIITGHSGSGKSTVMRHVALQLQTKDHYDIFPAMWPEEIEHHFDFTKHQVFVFDDVFGKYAINLHSIEKWMLSMNKIKALLESKTLKIMMTCRSHIVIHEQFNKVKWLMNNSCNVQDYKLNKNTLHEIAKKHLGDESTKIIKELDSLESIEFFPLLCETRVKLTQMEVDVKSVDMLFNKPRKALEEVIVDYKVKDKPLYVLLALFVIHNNLIDKRMFETKSFQDKCRVIARACEIHNFSIKELKFHFARLQKYFIKLSGHKYKIFHDKIFDILVSIYGENMFEEILELSHSDIIKERFHFESINDRPEIGLLIFVPAQKEELYFKRLFVDTNREILNNEITFTAFANRQLQYDSYRKKFIEFCRANSKLTRQILLLSFKATSPLLEVAAQGYIDVLEMLISMELDVNVIDGKGDTPLHKSSALGNTESVQVLLNNNADINLRNMSGESPLFKAAQNGHVDITKILVQRGSNINLKSSIGETPLYVASRGGYLKIVNVLLENRANVNKFDEYIGSPLHIATRKNHIDIIKVLLEKGADKDLSTKHIEAPLYIASLEGLHEAVKLLIDNEADPNKCGKDGRSPLCKAAWNGHIDAVKLLLKYNADPNKLSRYSESPLYKAARCGHKKIVKLLIKNGAKVNVCCSDKRSPLYKAAWQNHVEVVKVLLTNKADPDIASEYFGSPLYRAAKEGHIETVKILLKWRNPTCNINLQSKDEETALYAAAKMGHSDIVELLLNEQADPNIKDKQNETPLQAAKWRGHIAVVDILKNYHPVPNN